MNVDLAVLSGTRRWLDLPQRFHYYDIACQQLLKLEKRLLEAKNLLEGSKSISPEDVDALLAHLPTGIVPKFHVKAHKIECIFEFSSDFKEGTGCTDGEGQERVWADQNGLANSAREMNEGHRHDTLADHHDNKNAARSGELGEHSRYEE